MSLPMHDLPTIASSCGVLLGTDAQGRFEHIATAWSVGSDEWVTAWSSPEPSAQPPQDLRLLYTNTGAIDTVQNWEWEDGIAGFTAHVAANVPALPLRRGKELHKRDGLWTLGYPSMIDHPVFRLHRGSLDADRYFPD